MENKDKNVSNKLKGCLVTDLKESVEEYNSNRKCATQMEETKEMVELRAELKDHITPYLEDIYGGRNRMLQRYLIARDNNVKKAAKLFLDSLEIQKTFPLETDLDNMDENDLKSYKLFQTMWPIQFFGVSKDANLVLYSKLQHIEPKKFTSQLKEEQIKRFFALYGGESMRLQNYVNSVIRSQDDNEWRGTVEIFDMKKVSRKQLHISGLRVLNRVMKIGQSLFPDTLARSYVINVPWYFAAAWQIIKLGVDKNTAARTVISRSDCRKQLTELFGDEKIVDKMFASHHNSNTNKKSEI